MKFEVDNNYSRGLIIATPEVEGGYLGAYEYPPGAIDIDDPGRIMIFGLRANLLQIRPADLGKFRDGDFSAIGRYIEPITDYAGANAIHASCHLFPLGRQIGVNVSKTLFEFAPHDSASLE